jgi:hypothetical protein
MAYVCDAVFICCLLVQRAGVRSQTYESRDWMRGGAKLKLSPRLEQVSQVDVRRFLLCALLFSSHPSHKSTNCARPK